MSREPGRNVLALHRVNRCGLHAGKGPAELASRLRILIAGESDKLYLGRPLADFAFELVLLGGVGLIGCGGAFDFSALAEIFLRTRGTGCAVVRSTIDLGSGTWKRFRRRAPSRTPQDRRGSREIFAAATWRHGWVKIAEASPIRPVPGRTSQATACGCFADGAPRR